MKRFIIPILTACLVLCACEDHLVVEFDTPFVSITDSSGLLSEMNIGATANNFQTELTVRLCISDHHFNDPVEVEYDLICGDGLTEGVDFKVQPTTKSPIKFTKEDGYFRPIRITWYKNGAYDPAKDNTLTVRLTKCSLKNSVIGYPGKDHIKSEFTFTKQ